MRKDRIQPETILNHVTITRSERKNDTELSPFGTQEHGTSMNCKKLEFPTTHEPNFTEQNDCCVGELGNDAQSSVLQQIPNGDKAARRRWRVSFQATALRVERLKPP